MDCKLFFIQSKSFGWPLTLFFSYHNRISDRGVQSESAPEQAREKECLNIGELSSVSFSAEYYLRPQLASLTIDKRGLWNWGVARQPCSFSDQQIQEQIQTNKITMISTNTIAGTRTNINAK